MESIERPELIKLLHSHHRLGQYLVLSPEARGVSYFCSIDEVHPDYVTVKNPVPPETIHYMVTAPKFKLFVGSFWLESENLVSHGCQLKFEIPEVAYSSQVRSSQRITVAENEEVYVKIKHPFDTSTILVRKVFDYSTDGLSFRSNDESRLIQPGRKLKGCVLIKDGELIGNYDGEIVYVKQIIWIDGKIYHQVGLRFVGS